MVGEVPARTAEEGVLAHERDELLQHRRALGVGDPVEVQLRRFEIGDVGDDRVRRRQLILHVRPPLPPAGEGDPGIRVPSRDDRGVRPHEVRERLLEPQVVPPAHRGEVAEPHVGHLVQDRVRAPLVLRRGGCPAEDVPLGEGHEARVLHRPEVVLGHEDLVVLAPRIHEPERVAEEVEAAPRDLEDLVGVARVDEVRRERGTTEDPERHGTTRAVPAAVDARVRPGGDRRDVARQRQRLGERDPHPTVDRLTRRLGAVREHLPVLGCEHDEAPLRLQVGLLEDGIDTSAVGGFVLRVQVDSVVDWVAEAVQPLARRAVAARSAHRHDVLRDQIRDPYAGAVPVDRLGGAVDRDLVDGRPDEVDPRRVDGCLEHERRRCGEGRGIRRLRPAQVDLDVDGAQADTGRAGRGLVTGEVGGGGHASMVSCRGARRSSALLRLAVGRVDRPDRTGVGRRTRDRDAGAEHLRDDVVGDLRRRQASVGEDLLTARVL